MHGRRPVDEDRLPWLEPYKEAIAPKPRVARRSRGGLVALVAALLLIPVAVGAGFWFGQRSGLQAPPQSTETIALPEARPQTQPVQVAVAPPAEPAPVVEQAAVAANLPLERMTLVVVGDLATVRSQLEALPELQGVEFQTVAP